MLSVIFIIVYLNFLFWRVKSSLFLAFLQELQVVNDLKTNIQKQCQRSVMELETEDTNGY